MARIELTEEQRTLLSRYWAMLDNAANQVAQAKQGLQDIVLAIGGADTVGGRDESGPWIERSESEEE